MTSLFNWQPDGHGCAVRVFHCQGSAKLMLAEVDHQLSPQRVEIPIVQIFRDPYPRILDPQPILLIWGLREPDGDVPLSVGWEGIFKTIRDQLRHNQPTGNRLV